MGWRRSRAAEEHQGATVSSAARGRQRKDAIDSAGSETGVCPRTRNQIKEVKAETQLTIVKSAVERLQAGRWQTTKATPTLRTIDTVDYARARMICATRAHGVERERERVSLEALKGDAHARES